MTKTFCVASALAGVLLTAACGVNPGRVQSAPGGADHGASAASREPIESASVDPALVRGLSVATFTDDKARIKTEIPQIPVARSLSVALEVVREKTLRTAAYADASAVALKWRLIGSAPGALGVAVTSEITTANGKQVTPLAVWYDTKSRKTYSSPILIDSQKWGSFKTEVDKVAKAEGIDPVKLSQALDADPAPQGVGPALEFDAQGNLIVSFASGVLKPEPTTLRIPSRTASALLSTFGSRAMDAATLPLGFDGTPPVVEASTPAPSSDATAGNQVPRPSTAVGVDCAKAKCAALTFDDGPVPESVEVVEALKKYRMPATFFQLGEHLQEHPEAGKAIVAAGNEVGNHSMTHPSLTETSSEKLAKEVNGTADLMASLYGSRPSVMRPPNGSHNKTVDAAIGQAGASVVMWDVDTRDWETKNTASTVNSAVAGGVKGGTIVLLHDIHSFSRAAVPGILEGWKKAGVTAVTVNELSLNSGVMEAGRAYCSATYKQGGLCS